MESFIKAVANGIYIDYKPKPKPPKPIINNNNSPKSIINFSDTYIFR